MVRKEQKIANLCHGFDNRCKHAVIEAVQKYMIFCYFESRGRQSKMANFLEHCATVRALAHIFLTKVKAQCVHLRLHTNYFLLPLKIPEEMSK